MALDCTELEIGHVESQLTLKIFVQKKKKKGENQDDLQSPSKCASYERVGHVWEHEKKTQIVLKATRAQTHDVTTLYLHTYAETTQSLSVC